MAATSSAVKYSRPLTLGERSNGVIVRLENVPCRSGSPHGVFGAVYGFDGVAFAPAFWAMSADDDNTVAPITATAAITHVAKPLSRMSRSSVLRCRPAR